MVRLNTRVVMEQQHIPCMQSVEIMQIYVNMFSIYRRI